MWLDILLYDLVVLAYRVVLRLAAPFHPKAERMLRGRRTLWETLHSNGTAPDRRTILFHCASAGEFEQGRPVIEDVRKAFPRHRIVVSFFSTSGYDQAQGYAFADHIVYLPMDTRRAAHRFVGALQPEVAVFVKYEYWYHIFKALRGAGARILVISAIFRPHQIFFKPYGRLHRKMLRMAHHLYVQDKASADLLRSIGFTDVTVSGDTRCDRVLALAGQQYSDDRIERFASGHDVMVIGSSWPEDIRAIAPMIRDSSVPMKYLIAPHEVDGSSIEGTIKQIGAPCLRYSNFDEVDYDGSERVLVIDKVGLLSRVYRYGCMAYVGGGFAQGLHNILEPAVYSMPVFFGKGRDNEKYREAVELTARGGAFEVAGYSDLAARVKHLLADREALRRAGNISRQYIVDHAGADRTITEGVMQLLRR